MDTSPNNSVTPIFSNMGSYISNKFDAIIDGTYFEIIRKEVEYCVGHPKIK